jgi:hypothetical protein
VGHTADVATTLATSSVHVPAPVMRWKYLEVQQRHWLPSRRSPKEQNRCH